MPFFANAQNVTITNSPMQEIHGDLTIHNGHVYNVDSFNKTDTRTTGSHNDSSKKWGGTGEFKKGHPRRDPPPRGGGDSLTGAQENDSRTASAPRPAFGAPVSSRATNALDGDITAPSYHRQHSFLSDEDVRHLRESTDAVERLKDPKTNIPSSAGRARPLQVDLTDTSDGDCSEEESDGGEHSQLDSLRLTTTSVIPPTSTPLLHSVSATPSSPIPPAPAPPPHSVSYTPSPSSALPETPFSTVETTTSSTVAQNSAAPPTSPAKSKNPLGHVKRIFQKKKSSKTTTPNTK